MIKENDQISGIQFSIISFFLTGSLFVGLGIISMFYLAGRDIWITALCGIALSIIPALLFIYIYNYQPDKNIFEKNIILFGKWIGSIINFILCGFVYFMMLVVLWSNTTFAITIYLIKTPELFIAGIFVITAIYAVIKGIETIGRASQILFYINIVFVSIIIISLVFQFNSDFFKPVLVKGLSPVLLYTTNILSYLFTPLFIMGIIPKNSLKNSKHSTKYIIGSYMMGAVFMTIVFVLIAGVITPELASFYRLPAYYVQRKVSIAGAVNNLENFLSLHWFFNTFMLIIMGLYFISQWPHSIIKFKSDKIKKAIIFIIGASLVYFRKDVFHDAIVSIVFMKYKFTAFVTLPILILISIMIIMIFIKRHKKKAT